MLRETGEERARLGTVFNGREAQLLARILDKQALGQGYRCEGPTETALLRSLRIRGMIERLLALKKSQVARWRVTAWGLGHPAIGEGGAVYAYMGEVARAKYGGSGVQVAAIKP